MFIIANLFMLLFFAPKTFLFRFLFFLALQVHVCDIVLMQISVVYGAHLTQCYDSHVQLALCMLLTPTRQRRKNRILFKWKGHSTETCCTAKCNSAARIKISASSSSTSALAQNFNFFSSRRATCCYFFSANEIEIVFFLLSSSLIFIPKKTALWSGSVWDAIFILPVPSSLTLCANISLLSLAFPF